MVAKASSSRRAPRKRAADLRVRTEPPAPARLIGADGRPAFGVFADAVGEVNIGDYRHRTPMGRTAGFLDRWLGFKRFQYFGVISDEVLFGCALADLRTLALAFVYVHVPGVGMVVERSVRAPLGLGVRLSTSPIGGTSRFASGALQVDFAYSAAPRRKSVRVRLGKDLDVEASFDESAARFEPMSLCTRVGRNGWVYAHKVAGVPVTGRLRSARGEIDLARAKAYAHHDFSAGYMRRETFWNWACLSGRSADGHAIGLNVSCGVNETSFSENCFWLDGRIHPLGLCHFEYDWDRPLEPWRVASGDGRLELDFQPEGQHRERLDLGFAASDFKQVFGRFRGELRTAEGRVVPVADCYGFVEDQYAKW